jgi:hypothetical protein
MDQKNRRSYENEIKSYIKIKSYHLEVNFIKL